jgi:ketosteroid isomerase-like protein
MGKNVDIVKGVYSAFASGNVPAVLGAFDAGIQWLEAEGFLYADGNPYAGPMGVAQGVFQRIVTDMDGLTVIPEQFIDGGDAIVVEGRYKGMWKATQAKVDAQFAHIWHIRDGKVVRFQQYTDTRQWADAAKA